VFYQKTEHGYVFIRHLHLNCAIYHCHARIQLARIYCLQQPNKFSLEHVNERQTWWQRRGLFSNLTDLALYQLDDSSVYSDMASNTPFPKFKTTGDDKHDLETFIQDLKDYCIMQNWFDPSKETDALKWTKPDKAMACLWASLSPAARTVYKYSLGLDEAN